MPANSSSTCERLRERTMRPETRSAGAAPLQRRAALTPQAPRASHRLARHIAAALKRQPCLHRAGTEVARAVFHDNILRSASRPALPGAMSGSWVMTILKYVGTVGAA